MSYYPDLRGELFLEEDAVDVFAGVAEYLPHEDAIDDISECPLLLPPPLHLYIFVPGRTAAPHACCIFHRCPFLPAPRKLTFPPPIRLLLATPFPRRASVGTNPVAANLVLNYSPHLSPNTREAAPAVELRNVLQMAARDMLEVYLRKWRTKMKMEDLKRAQHLQPIIVVSDDLGEEVF